jgi:hypothetical protein
MHKYVIILTLAGAVLARADFSYTTTRQGATNEAGTKHYLKGQKMMLDSGRTVTIMDFDAQTITTINNTDKTYRVRSFSDIGVGAAPTDVQADVKSTGQTKTINGFKASEVVMTMQMDMTTARGNMKMQMEMHTWVSPDVPGSDELHAFYKRNMSKFPWSAMTQGGANASMQKAMADLQRKMADLNGVPVLQVVKMGGGGGAATPTDAQSAQMAQARARLEEMQKQGGAQAQAATQALARMGAVSGGGSGFETTMESSNFSSSPIPDSTFAIPAGYQKSEK